MEETNKPLQNFFNNFFTVAANPRTYSNIFYLLLSFPLGIFYFVFFITGISLGLGLIPVFIGLPLIMFMFFSANRLMAFECMLAKGFTGVNIPLMNAREICEGGMWKKFRAHVSDPQSWKSLAYLVAIKFPLGIFAFVLAVTLGTVSLALVFCPVIYQSILQGAGIDIFRQDIFSLFAPGYFSSMEKSFIYMAAGIFVTFISLHVLNFVTYISAKLTALMVEEW